MKAKTKKELIEEIECLKEVLEDLKEKELETIRKLVTNKLKEIKELKEYLWIDIEELILFDSGNTIGPGKSSRFYYTININSDFKLINITEFYDKSTTNVPKLPTSKSSCKL